MAKRYNEKTWAEIAEDYKGGMSLQKVKDKYGISTSSTIDGMKKRGIPTRGVREAINSSGWVKLTKIGRGSSRLLCIAGSLLKGCGFDVTREMRGKWEINGNTLVLNIKYTDELEIDVPADTK